MKRAAVPRGGGGSSPAAPFAALLLFAGFQAAFNAPAWIACLSGGVAAGLFAAIRSTAPAAIALWALGASVAAGGIALADDAPLPGLALACAPLFGGAFAMARLLGTGFAAAIHLGVAAAFAGLLAATQAAATWGSIPADGGLDGLIFAEFHALRDAALGPGANLFGGQPELRLRAEEFFRDENNRFDFPRLFAWTWTLIASLLAMALAAPKRPLGARLARYRANERQIPLLIAALLAYLAAPKLGAGDGFRAWSTLFLQSAAALLWLQALAVAAWTIRRGRREGNKPLAATGWIGAAVIVSSHGAGLVLGFADAYLDIRKQRPRPERG